MNDPARAFLGLMVALLALGACGGATRPGEPAGTCEEAPAYLVAELQSRITTDGVTLDRAYIGPATDLPEEITARASAWWWVVGQLGDVDDPIAIWLVNNRSEGGTHIYLAANAVAQRHGTSDWALDPSSLVGGAARLIDCLR